MREQQDVEHEVKCEEERKRERAERERQGVECEANEEDVSETRGIGRQYASVSGKTRDGR